MRFWDSSALVPLLVEEESTNPLERLYLSADAPMVWWGAVIECASAVSRLEREGRLTVREASQTLNLLESMATI